MERLVRVSTGQPAGETDRPSDNGALPAAARDCAESKSLGKEVVSLEPGRLADLPLVEDDSTVEITALKQAGAVFEHAGSIHAK
jgi:hypothetical protein